MKNFLKFGTAIAIVSIFAVSAADAKQQRTRVTVTPVNHAKACADLHKGMYRSPQDGHIHAIGGCRASRGDISDIR
jgi:hypothetical protein